MEKNEHIEYSPSQQRGKRQIVILSQLLQASTEMKHVDGILSWLANEMVRQLDVQLIQLWAVQAFSNKQMSIMLRANAFEDRSLPQHIFYNAHLVEVIGNLISTHQGIAPQSVNRYFSSHQTNLFQRYGLNYCFGYFLESNDLLPPALSLPSGVATPFMMYALLVTHAIPPSEIIIAINQILAQIAPIARRRGLLGVPVEHERSGSTGSHPSQKPLSLADLIPVHLKDMSAMRTTNPFASGINLEKKALRLYQSIDGRKSIAEITYLTRYSEKEMLDALRILIQQKLIRMQDATGREFDSSQLI